METGKFNRRQFLKFTSAAFAGMVITPIVYLAINNELNEPVVKRVLLPVRNLPAAFEGFRLVALADFHLYPYTQPELVRKSIALANSLKPDLGVFLGDYVWRNLDAIYELAPLLAGLDAKHGIFGIIGYHDIWLNRQVVESALHQAGIPMLVNQGISIAQGSGVINLVGLDDGWSGRPDLDAARQGLQKEAPTILLMHEPDLADTYSQDRYISLQLSGHTHGGQVRINGKPFILPYLGRKYDLGLYRVNQMWLYTNPGIGVISVPARYNCPPEVTEITLTANIVSNGVGRCV